MRIRLRPQPADAGHRCARPAAMAASARPSNTPATSQAELRRHAHAPSVCSSQCPSVCSPGRLSAPPNSEAPPAPPAGRSSPAGSPGVRCAAVAARLAEEDHQHLPAHVERGQKAAASAGRTRGRFSWKASTRISSLEKKPASGGNARQRQPADQEDEKVTGMLPRSAAHVAHVLRVEMRLPCAVPMPVRGRHDGRAPCPGSPSPAARNSSALKKACVTRWNMPATYAPMPAAATMKPSWLMVE